MSEKIPGYQFIANTLKGYGLTHIFYVEAMLRMVNRQFGEMDVKRIMAHSENAAAYMADGYARMSGKPGICMSQSIGSANLAGGIRSLAGKLAGHCLYWEKTAHLPVSRLLSGSGPSPAL